MKATSGQATDPLEPSVKEPGDLERFFNNLTEPFQLSNTENLTALHTFRPLSRENIEGITARFNDIARALKMDDYPLVTFDQLRTYYQYHLESMLCEEEADDLQRRIREEDRIRERYDEEVLSREELHRMAMETD